MRGEGIAGVHGSLIAADMTLRHVVPRCRRAPHSRLLVVVALVVRLSATPLITIGHRNPPVDWQWSQVAVLSCSLLVVPLRR